ncbi:MAG: hypothetical protein KME07_06040 [Pegethrix bostrychoides GSE-TBD4-15B]|jgi:hypothetical protein|uniref:Uncharacterized protein n=1 Tax=Pegethrix bostrychoides GSE-TBD4-15B TaxID=2839662 RepID=A0A951U431_9CYAN|nr:hypothetical protein [Pegethrix bostrychoides GSE-TBD4-15B]
MAFSSLSPYTQYYIRRLLRQYVGSLNYPPTGVGICAYLQQDLNELLAEIYPQSQLNAKLHELDMLVQHHQLSGTEGANPYGGSSDIEQKILWLLDLRFLALLPAMSLSIVPEDEASRFHFMLRGNMHEGLRHADDLYGKVLEFGAEHELPTYSLLLTLINQQTAFLLTASKSRHVVWVDLRSPSYYRLMEQSSQAEELQKTAFQTAELRKIA